MFCIFMSTKYGHGRIKLSEKSSICWNRNFKLKSILPQYYYGSERNLSTVELEMNVETC